MVIRLPAPVTGGGPCWRCVWGSIL